MIRISNNDYPLSKETDITVFEQLVDGNVSSGQPYRFIWRNKEIGLFTPPDQVYTITIYGRYDLAKPETDEEADNVWMAKGVGYEPVLHKALSYMFAFHARNEKEALKHEGKAQQKIDQLYTRSNRLKSRGRTKPSTW